jgi:hypothetical protein
MPIIYLKHERHGLKIATMELEAEHDEQHGWERYTPGQPEAQENALTPRRRRKDPDGNDRARPD